MLKSKSYIVNKNPRQALFHMLFLYFLLTPVILPAQSYPTRNYTMRDGLPGIAIQSIYKDSRGLMWIGTQSGLCTYDGKSFRIFNPSEGMTANQVWAIAEDDKGNMWFGTYGEGLYKYDGTTFKRYTEKEGLIGNKIRVLCWSDNFHCLVVGCVGGISTLRGDSIINSPAEIFSKEDGAMVTGLFDAGKFIYVTTFGKNNPLRYYPYENKFVKANNQDQKYPIHSFSVFITSEGDTVFSQDFVGVSIYKRDNQIIHNKSMGQVFSIQEDKRGDLWFASWSYAKRNMIEGVFRYDGQTFRNYKSAFGITDNEIWTVFYDREQDILWVGTLNEGLFMVPFSHMEQFPPSYFGLEEQKINDIHIDNNSNLWISGTRELIKIDPGGGLEFADKRKILAATKEFWQNTKRKNFDYTIKDSIDLILEEMNAQKLSDLEQNIKFNFLNVKSYPGSSIYFTNRFGLFEYNTVNGSIACLGPEGSTDFFELAGKDTVIFTGRGATVINSNIKLNYPYFSDDSFINFNKAYDPDGINRVRKNKSQIWYTSSTTGLWMSEGMELVNFNLLDSTISKHINDVCFDGKGRVFFGSNSGEIYVATYADKKLKIEHRINSDNGLAGNSISWLVYDPKGYLWAGTNLGLNCIGLNDLYENGDFTIRFFDEEDGYNWQGSENAVIDSSEKIWIGAFDQLVSLDTKGLLTKDVQPGIIYLQSFEINNVREDSIIEGGVRSGTEITFSRKLKHTENDLVLYFDIINYKNPGKDLFRHRLIGEDEDGIPWSNSRKVAYTNLSPGNYKLIVESKNIQTLNQTAPFIINFRIRHPWWGLWYLQFLALCIVFASGIIIMWKYSEAKRKKQQAKLEIEKTIVELEMQALQAQMNPHFIFNCINGIQYYVLSNQMDQVFAYLSDFSKVVRGSLENATTPMVKLKSEIEFLKSYLRLEEMRFEDKFDYEIKMADANMAETRLLPPMFIQPFVENSIKHGFMSLETKGRLLIEFEEEKLDVLKCTITDNGVGRKKSAEKEVVFKDKERLHSGLITENRIRLFNKTGEPEKYMIVYTDLQSESSGGLKVEIYLPMEKGGE